MNVFPVTNLMTSFYYKLFLCNLEFFLMCDIIIDNMDVRSKVSCIIFYYNYIVIRQYFLLSHIY